MLDALPPDVERMGRVYECGDDVTAKDQCVEERPRYTSVNLFTDRATLPKGRNTNLLAHVGGVARRPVLQARRPQNSHVVRSALSLIDISPVRPCEGSRHETSATPNLR